MSARTFGSGLRYQLSVAAGAAKEFLFAAQPPRYVPEFFRDLSNVCFCGVLRWVALTVGVMQGSGVWLTETRISHTHSLFLTQTLLVDLS